MTEEPTPLTDEELERFRTHFRMGGNMAVSARGWERALATIDAERAKIAELKSKLLHQAMAWEASSIAAEEKVAELEEENRQLTDMVRALSADPFPDDSDIMPGSEFDGPNCV